MSEGKRVKVNCETCNKQLDKLASRLALYPRSFCSRKCSGEARKADRPPCKTEGCGKPYHCRGYCSSCYDKFRYNSSPSRKEEKIAWAKKRLGEIKKIRESDSNFNEEYLAKARIRSREQRKKHYESKLRQDRNNWKKPKRRFNKAKREAERRGLEFTITIEDYNEIITRPCYYECGNPVSAYGSGLDRLDSSLGYTPENSVPCCPLCNQVKGAFIGGIEMKSIVDLLKGFRGDNIWENCKFGTRTPGKPRKS